MLETQAHIKPTVSPGLLTLLSHFSLCASAVDHMSAYYQSCDAFPVAMVTGIDLQDEECVAIMKRVSASEGNGACCIKLTVQPSYSVHH